MEDRLQPAKASRLSLEQAVSKPYLVLTTCCGDQIPDDCGYFGTLDEVREFIADIPEDESVSVYCFELVPIDAWKEVGK